MAIEILGLIGGIAKPILSKGAAIAWENRNYLGLFLKTKYGTYKNQNIRFSISGIIKIKIPNTNKYLLVLNRRIENQLQPVGGVYKRFGDDSLFNKWEYKPDNSKNGLDVDDKSSSDLRFMVSGKYSTDVLNWFESGQERENSPVREFREELIDTNILSPNTFGHIDYKHIRRFSKNLVWSEFFSCYEILIFDVFELIPTSAQKEALIELSKHENDLSKGYAIVSCDDIEQQRLMIGNKQVARIGQHTKLLINKTF
ncbi:SMODS-associated NUDIX domain-containing protein [Chryseobacterium flavum]|uniref:SMODS-associated NUDIX domain-containing protein n=1 Tax=Chryseobacterium flavum TaxID=415851 RepID=UPI0028B06281|nr:hypothetical protein [Chryseobacterium flavum]